MPPQVCAVKTAPFAMTSHVQAHAIAVGGDTWGRGAPQQPPPPVGAVVAASAAALPGMEDSAQPAPAAETVDIKITPKAGDAAAAAEGGCAC